MIKQLYNKCLKLASHKNSNYFLAIVSFLESSFFPIPPDIMIAPMAIAKKNDFLKIFLTSTIFSVLGGMLGYFIGAYFFDFAMNIVEFYNYEKEVIDLKRALSQGGGFYTWLGILFLAGFTPLPYKVFTIASGLISFNFPIFVLISLISRGLRFFIVSYLSSKFGDTFSKFMNRYGQKWFSIIGIVIVFIGAIFYFSIKFYD
jgi:membrane protein YqaA with SNARE-associated domain